MVSQIPPLHLNQSNLEDFRACPRKFQLKVIEKIDWPAPSIEPLSSLERSTKIGNDFHLLSHQYFSGIDSESIKSTIKDPDVKNIWELFFPKAEELIQYPLYSEIILSAPFNNHHLIAKFDLLIKISPKKFVIFDWKTAQNKPQRAKLVTRFQTFLYPFIFLRSGFKLFDQGDISPENISMNYWYPLSEEPEEIFPYSQQQYSENQNELISIVKEIDSMAASGSLFPLTDDHTECSKCEFRSLCERGSRPGKLDPYTAIEDEDLSNQHFELESISGLEF